jgi:hypothetical protein
MRARLPPRHVARRARTGSWLALLAAATVGDAAHTLRAEVRADGLAESESYRLVVQTYDASSGELPSRRARPVGSVQRAVTAAELREGVQVNLLELRGAPSAGGAQDPLVVAWVESGEPDLEFDGRTARPRPGSVYGVVKRGAKNDVIRISLNRRFAV